MSKKIKLTILVLIIILLGFLRDYLFYNINWIYLTLTIDRPNQALPEFHFLLGWTPNEINVLKWFLTFLFTLLFFLLTYRIIQFVFKNRTYNKITIGLYAVILIVSLALYLFGLVIGMSENLYGVVRTLMGIVQSFMPLMILYILFKFLPTIKQSEY